MRSIGQACFVNIELRENRERVFAREQIVNASRPGPVLPECRVTGAEGFEISSGNRWLLAVSSEAGNETLRIHAGPIYSGCVHVVAHRQILSDGLCTELSQL